MLELYGDRGQNALARDLGINAARLSHYATGRKAISAHHLILLAQALDCPATDLIGYVELGNIDEEAVEF